MNGKRPSCPLSPRFCATRSFRYPRLAALTISRSSSDRHQALVGSQIQRRPSSTAGRLELRGVNVKFRMSIEQLVQKSSTGPRNLPDQHNWLAGVNEGLRSKIERRIEMTDSFERGRYDFGNPP